MQKGEGKSERGREREGERERFRERWEFTLKMVHLDNIYFKLFR